jgi:hypothetical protein
VVWKKNKNKKQQYKHKDKTKQKRKSFDMTKTKALNSRIHILLFFCIKSLFLLEYPFDLSRLTLFYCQTPSALSNSMFKFQVTTEILFQEQYFLMNENIIQCFDIRVFPKGWATVQT